MLMFLVVMDMVKPAETMLHTLPGQLVCLVACKASYWPVIERLNWYIRQCIEYDRGLCRKHNSPVPRPVLSDFMFCRSAFVYAVESLGAPVTLGSLRVGMRRWKDSNACDIKTLLKASVPFAITKGLEYNEKRKLPSMLVLDYAAHECAILGNSKLLFECLKNATAANIHLSVIVWYAMAAHHGEDYANKWNIPPLRYRRRGFNRAILETVMHDDAVTMEKLFLSYEVNFEFDIDKNLVYRKATEYKADACLKLMKRYDY